MDFLWHTRTAGGSEKVCRFIVSELVILSGGRNGECMCVCGAHQYPRRAQYGGKCF